MKSVQPLVYDRVTLPDLDGRVAVLIGAEVSTQLLTRRQPAQGHRWSSTRLAAQLQLLPVCAAIQSGDFKPRGQLLGQDSRAAGDGIAADLRRVAAPQRGPASRSSSATRPRDVECLPVGVVDFDDDSPLAPLGKNFIGMSVGQAARVIRPLPPARARSPAGSARSSAEIQYSPQKVNRIDLFLEPGADRDAVRTRRGGVVGKRAERPHAGRAAPQHAGGRLRLADRLPGLLRRRDDRRPVPRLQRDGRHGRRAPRRTSASCARSGRPAGRSSSSSPPLAAVLGLIGAVLGVPLGICASPKSR